MVFRKKTAPGPGKGHHRSHEREFGGTWDEKLQRYVWPGEMVRIQREVRIEKKEA